ncbi:transglycosylase domain-containing protein [Plantactinospora sp. GCM10030261]|uniref:transglycosylase domain-containing protein n=1 Tax=Plantactinospora sp. GCM10030261 TaxID=3273420 RepID=UPI00360637C5
MSPGGAASGQARAGRASVPVSGGSGGSGGYGDGSGGYGGGGTAGYLNSGGSTGRATPGRASVGSASVNSGSAGRATVGRASVRPVSPAGYGPGGPGPGGPGGSGPGRPGGGRGGNGDAARGDKKRKRLNLIIAAFAVFIMLSGIGVVGGTYYSTKVVLPEDIALRLSTTIYASDNKEVIAKLGEENREFVTINQVPQYVQDAVVSAEDRKFYQHSGVDYAGIARAAWNNFTGGTKQGASTITQQYARNAIANLKDDTYARKVKEAILASKLNDKYPKPTIMQHYLNTIFFGRGAHGIEAASKAYFGKPANKLTVAEGAVLAAVIKQPEPSSGHKGYDPANNPQAAKDRWTYVLDGMVEMGKLAPQDRPTEYPKVLPPKNGNSLVGVNTPRGNVVNYIDDELAAMGICTLKEGDGSGKPTCSDELRYGGLRIQTSINPKMQKAAEATARRKAKGSEVADERENVMAAVVSVDPKNGRVVAYYGGDSGAGTDYAGTNVDTAGNLYGGHQPGSTFKVYTLAAALEAGISLDSRWDSSTYKPKNVPFTVRNVRENNQTKCGKYCTLEESTLSSYNVPFYKIAEDIGADKVIDMARAAGVSTMWSSADNPPKPYDLAKTEGKKLAPTKSGSEECQANNCPFFYNVAFGQYPVTVLDHANGIATIANRGTYNKAHFVVGVWRQNQETGEWNKIGGEQLKPQKRIRPEVTDDVTAVLKKYPAKVNHTLAGNRPAASKTGTWELNEKDDKNAHAWMVGYTPQLATAVWVGNVGPKTEALLTKSGKNMYGSDLPGDIWERYMEGALKGEKELSFPDKAGLGDPNLGDGKSPEPPAPEQPQNPAVCPNPFNPACPPPGEGNGNGNNNPFPNITPRDGGDDGGGGGGGGLLPTPTATRRE